jgi:hypothetical protein
MVQHPIVIFIHPSLKRYQLIVIGPQIIPPEQITQIIKGYLFQVLIINQRDYLSCVYTLHNQIPQLLRQSTVKSKKYFL